MHFLLIPAGFVLGSLVGFVTRPTFLGVQPPFGILFSTHPADQRFREEMLTHLGIYGVIGLVAGAVAFGIMQAVISKKMEN